MDIPDLIKQRLGDEELEAAVNLGDEDVICFTPTRTLIYHGEGLLSDQSIEEYDHDVERLDVSEGRRKTSFTLTYVDREASFSVSADRGEPVLERLLGGILGTAGVTGPEEDVEGVFLFSELTLVITERRLVKHVGRYVWDEDYEEFPYSKVTGLDFEDGSVATQIIISIDGRPERIKAPSKDAQLVKRTLTNALFEFYEVGTLDQLNEAVDSGSASETKSADEDDGLVSSDIQLDDSITPLVGGDDNESGAAVDDNAGETSTNTGETNRTVSGEQQRSPGGQNAGESNQPATREVNQADSAIDPAEFEAMKERLGTITTAVKRQNKLLKQQHDTIETLVEELKRERR